MRVCVCEHVKGMSVGACVCVCVCAWVCVCVCQTHLGIMRERTIKVKIRQGAMAPFISPWPTKLLMLGEDIQSDQLHVTAIGTVDFCFSMKLFALKV